MTLQDGWLQISTSGFAALNQSRPPSHLVKELVQNSLDAVGDGPGVVALDYQHGDGEFYIECSDSGTGIEDLATVQVVYLTLKTDSHLKRGRFGRGFKEILSVANAAEVASGMKEIAFFFQDGRQVTQQARRTEFLPGTTVRMAFSWGAKIAEGFDTYFRTFLVPENIEFLVNGAKIPSRPVCYLVPQLLPTEVYDPETHSWKKPRRKTVVELVEAMPDEEPFIYEMGIPIAPAEWSISLHANVQQRVPMNPNRDALASGFAKRIHAGCLPVVLDDLTPEQTTADWVASAGLGCDDDIQQEILKKAFGEDAVRSVPTMGKRDYDDDAERAGATILKTSQMSGGFRLMAKSHLRSAKDLVHKVEAERSQEAAEHGFKPEDLRSDGDERRQWIERRGGRRHVDGCLSFAVWFCQQLLDSTNEHHEPAVTGRLALGNRPQLFGATVSTFLAHWSGENELTLALEADCFWEDPLGAECLSILVHEAAHSRNMHHAKSFNDEVERLAGIAAQTMFSYAELIRQRWPALV